MVFVWDVVCKLSLEAACFSSATGAERLGDSRKFPKYPCGPQTFFCTLPGSGGLEVCKTRSDNALRLSGTGRFRNGFQNGRGGRRL